ncbi:alanine racemase [Streptomyces sp. NPDC056405]|uniref:alanine racemase n=1 Tax=Streptomyces sp. NPDC056405 TaxID=3345811 RepID=UPI0035E34FFF
METAPRAEALIDLAALRDNLSALRERAGSAELMSVLKADAYGHGAVPCARAAVAAGVRRLGTATPEEALALRAAGIGRAQADVLCWLWTPGSPWREAVTADVEICVNGMWALPHVLDAVRATGRPARVHLKVDTGLGRNGASAREWHGLVAAARAAEAEGMISVTGVLSHLARADEPGHASIVAQLDAFREAVAVASKAGLRPRSRHIANSAATLTLPESRFDMVRVGLAQYGLSPVPELYSPAELGLRPVMTLCARVAHVKRVSEGHGISYGHTYRTTGETGLALVPLGYADGIPRHASSTGPVQVAGRRRTVAGRVAMDQFVVDLGSDAAEVEVGDPVEVFGAGEHGGPTAEEWARAAGTISYEIVTRIGARVPRRYLDGVG